MTDDEITKHLGYLGPKERQVCRLLMQGYTNSDIAKEMSISVKTVKSHLNRLFLRFKVDSGIKRVKLATMLSRCMK